jgi:hypothetical protein
MRDQAVSTNERLQQEAQAVLDVIENPDVIQALRQDKFQNLQYLKENYNVLSHPSHGSDYASHQNLSPRSLSSRSRLCTTLGSSSTHTGTTAAPLISCIISAFSRRTTT